MDDAFSPSLEAAFDIDRFRSIGHELIDVLADHLRKCKEGADKVIDYRDPEEEYNFWSSYEMSSPQALFSDIISRTIHTHHRRYIGHQVAAPAYIPALSGLVSELLNAGMGIYEMGAAATAIERVVIEEFCRKIGYTNDEGDGFLTSGGTLANLTALLAARAYLPSDRAGTDIIIVSDQAHFCIDRAAKAMGMKSTQVIKVQSDEQYRVDLSALRAAIGLCVNKGDNILAVVGCACSTSTGSYDDLVRIGELCNLHNIWFHVDGAHGGAAAWSSKYMERVRGIHLADSIIIDAHKMMMTPALATAVLFKRPSDSYKALAIKAEYLWEQSAAEWYMLAKRTYETTKLMMSIKIFSLIQSHGHQVIDDYVTRQYDLAHYFAAQVDSSPQLELAHIPMANIVCFRYLSRQVDDLDRCNMKIRSRLVERGGFYIVQTVLSEEVYLRITIMSPYTEKKDLDQLISEVIHLGHELDSDDAR